MRRRRRGEPLVGVVVPAYGVERWLPACLESLVAQTHQRWEAIVVDDGSPDRSGEVAEQWARVDARIRVVHTDNQGLGAARNVGLTHVRGDLVAFLDSDDVLPPTAYADLVGAVTGSGSDLVTASMVRWEGGGLQEPPWMHRLHNPARHHIRVADHPEILGDVFAWNKLYRRSFWDEVGLTWPEGVRYEDQPTTTQAFLAATFDVVPQIACHWRIREDGTSITQQRNQLADLTDRISTKRMALEAVRRHDDLAVERVFVDRVLPGDLHRYFTEIPGCADEWWVLLRAAVVEFWGERSLVHSVLPPAHRLCGWLVSQDRRDEAAALMDHMATRGAPLPRVQDPATSAWLLDVPAGVLTAPVVPDALHVRDDEV